MQLLTAVCRFLLLDSNYHQAFEMHEEEVKDAEGVVQIVSVLQLCPRRRAGHGTGGAGGSRMTATF
jgi:hypothetical protein